MRFFYKPFLPVAHETPVLAGVVVELGGHKLTMPPLNFAALKGLLPRIETMGGLSLSRETIALVTDCAFAALKRNYPSIARSDVEQWIDVANFAETFQACMDVGGLLRREQVGEVVGQPTGMESTSG